MTLEDLLNTLIQRGWKPFGKEAKEIYIDKNEITIERLNWFRVVYTTRQISSIDSWLWQFVCGKGLVDMYEWFYWQNIFPLDSQEYDYTDYQYWILESSLIDEDKLEKFLLDNIKIS